MKINSKTLLMSSIFSLVYLMTSFASLTSAYASLVETSQNQTFESEPQALGLVLPSRESSQLKLAAVHFITNDNSLNFGNQEFLPGDLCKQGGYTHNGCLSGYLKGEECPYDSKYVKECISPDSWCKSNGYTVTSCSVPNYPANPCPYLSSLYKSCEVDNIRACKEAGYSLTCEVGKIGDTAQVCPYNNSYKKCICNPCSGYAYTAAQASAQGYTPGEVCNSCGTVKYKRTENKCEGFKECTEGGTNGAEVCYSGNVKKFSECDDGCASKGFIYTPKDCAAISGDYVVDISRGFCHGKYVGCEKAARVLYGDGTVGMVSEIYTNKDKTPIGIVIDEENQLAVALTNVTVAGTLEDKKVRFASGINSSLELQRFENYNLCQSPSGKENTNVLLNAGTNSVMQAPFEAAELALAYQPAGCTKEFCQKGKWFLPSVEEWKIMKDKKDEILNLLHELYGRVYSQEVAAYYGLESETASYYKDSNLIDKAVEDIEGKRASSGFLVYTPFWLAKDDIYFSNVKWNYDGYVAYEGNLPHVDWASLNSVRPFITY